MELLRSIDDLQSEHRHGALSIGNFDGVHLGHARIVERLCAISRKVAGPSVVFTFDPHPVRILRPKSAPPPLTWTERKAELLARLGVDVLVAYPTDETFLTLTAEQFFFQVVLGQVAARAVVEGPNFFFGQNREGNVATLRLWCGEHEVSLEVVEPLQVAGSYISSSRIRELIRLGDVTQARELLTQPYRIRGMVTHGVGRGASIGFPTANVEAIDTLLPGQGVYAGMAQTGQARHPAAVNIGPNPTFGEEKSKVEVHLIGFEGNLYGQPLELDFFSRLRDIQPFDSVSALQEQLQQDVEQAQSIVENE